MGRNVTYCERCLAEITEDNEIEHLHVTVRERAAQLFEEEKQCTKERRLWGAGQRQRATWGNHQAARVAQLQKQVEALDRREEALRLAQARLERLREEFFTQHAAREREIAVLLREFKERNEPLSRQEEVLKKLEAATSDDPHMRGQALLVQGGVYIVQLLRRVNTFKIGHTYRFASRLPDLAQIYGPLSCILALPYEHPFQLEQACHAYFAPQRIYARSNPTELFVFHTARAQRHLEAFLQRFASFRLMPIQWDRQPPETLLPLFATVSR